MFLIYGLLIVAMMFFLLLPITDARTARMKLSVVSSLGLLLAVSRCGAAPDTLTSDLPASTPSPAPRRARAVGRNGGSA